MKKVKEFFEVWRIWNAVKTQPGIFKILPAVDGLIKSVTEHKRPTFTQVGLFYTGDDSAPILLDEFVCLWAGLGEANPLLRLKALRSQLNECKRLMQLVKDDKLTEQERKHLELFLEVLEY